MFRRREDSLFDNTTDPNQTPAEATTVTAPQSSQPQSAQPAASTSSSTSAYNSAAASSAPAARPAATTSAFRSTPISADLSRNRMPEAKSSLAGAMSSSSDKNKSAGGVRRVLTVGNDILLKGEIATCDRLVIEGKVDATLNDVHTVEIAESGSFKGSAHIEDAEISGLFEGDLVVRGRLVIYSTGKVRGKITYGEIEIERGGELTGEIKTSTGAQSQAMAPRPPRTQQQKEEKKEAA